MGRPRLLSQAEELQLIADYEAGATLEKVGFKFHVNLNTAARTLRRHGKVCRDATVLARERRGEKHPWFGKKRPDLWMKIKAKRRSYKGAESPSWKGGRYKQANGYIQVYSPTHPGRNKMGYMLEHRLVMEKHIDRLLDPLEVVHHINQKVDDNRIDNLMLFPNNGEHKKFEAKQKGGHS